MEYPDPACKLYDICHTGFSDSLQAESGWNILILLASCMTYTTAVYSEKLLMMDRGTV